ncbi:putative P-loop containing nucleoside triphosphate hydrolase protein [Rosellinia necatrix]|uniref:Putative P-loop containing nucleoside triphosphate hydrolase protein n=1 Tax=Rosellinia necatrix TaxID=77044 RepID=A0A1W2TCH0_ROSNE|nr:putative P-loop containing nucleoside triphosphate hydrolase protein [Rosellinia necatrix]
MIVLPPPAWRFATRIRSQPYKISFVISYRLKSSHCSASTQYRSVFEQQGRKPFFTPSREQLDIVNLCAVQNVVVSARPGSGKTATAEAIVAAHPDKRVAVLTYSKRLQLETSRRLRAYSNCDVLTFHGMASLLFGVVVYNDMILSEQRKRILDLNELPRWNGAPFDIIVLDEVQDCTELIFWLVSCFILASGQGAGDQYARLVVLGDERQSIYRFRGADHRYLTLAPELLAPLSPHPFSKVPLSQSFRLSDQTVRFVNQAFLGGESYITSSKHGPKPIVLRCHPRKDTYRLAKKLSSLINRYGPENSAILAPAVRKGGPLKDVVNILSKDFHVPIALSTDDEAPLDDRVIDGKVCISTIHQFKGSERDLVVLFGIDSSFFEYYGRQLPDDSCPNETFVALTRAAQQLVLIHDESQKLMPFVSVDALYKTAEIINMTSERAKIAPPDTPGRLLQSGLSLPSASGIRDMTRHLRDEYLDEIVKLHLCVQQTSPPLGKEDHIDIQNVVPSDSKKGFYEAVSDINGLVVVAAFEYDARGTLRTLDLNVDQYLIDMMSSPIPEQRISWLCRSACKYEAAVSGYLPRLIQMKDHEFNWIKPQDLDLARHRLQTELQSLAGSVTFECKANQEFRVGDQKTRLQGRADIVNWTTPRCNEDGEIESVWEIKFVAKLSNEHIVQVCTYAYLLSSKSGTLPRIILYNVRDGEKIEIIPYGGRDGLQHMVESVLRLKWTTTGEINSEEFIRSCTNVTQRVLNLDS